MEIVYGMLILDRYALENHYWYFKQVFVGLIIIFIIIVIFKGTKLSLMNCQFGVW